MNKDDYLVLTLPIKPQEKTNVGMMLSPTVMDYIGSVLDIKKCIGFNTLHSYMDKDTSLDEYLNYVNKSSISYDYIFVDKDRSEDLLYYVDKMLFSNLLKEKTITKLRCSCGKVDMVYDLSNNNKMYRNIGNKLICNSCNSECKVYNEKSLVLEINNDKIIPSISPLFLEKEMNAFAKTYKNTNILVSKNRDTSFVLSKNGSKYNIDIDFIWSNYFNLFDENNEIFIASNHQLFVMYLMNYIASISSNKNLTFVANPYLKMNLNDAKEMYEKRLLSSYKKLLLLYSLKWKNKDCEWSNSVYTYLNGISDSKLNNLYKSMLIDAKESLKSDKSLASNINDILNINTNMQNNIKVMKKLYKEGRL